MSLSMYDVSVPVITRMLNNLTAILKKGEAFAEARKIDPAVLIGSRLAPDMFDLARQVGVATYIAQISMAELAGMQAPALPEMAGDFSSLYARIAKTLEFVGSLDTAALAESQDKRCVMKLGIGELVMPGQQLILTFTTPNIYFHITTAYLILRHNGVELGKLDFTGG